MTEKDLGNFYGTAPDVQKDPVAFMRWIQSVADHLYFMTRGVIPISQEAIKSPTVATSATVPAATAFVNEQMYWNSTSDVLFYNHLGTAKPVGGVSAPVPWWNYTSMGITQPVWSFVTDLNQVITPSQNCVVVIFAQGILTGPGGINNAYLRVYVSPTPADFKSNPGVTVNVGNISFWMSGATTLSAGVAYTVGLQGYVDGGAPGAGTSAWNQNVYVLAS